MGAGRRGASAHQPPRPAGVAAPPTLSLLDEEVSSERLEGGAKVGANGVAPVARGRRPNGKVWRLVARPLAPIAGPLSGLAALIQLRRPILRAASRRSQTVDAHARPASRAATGSIIRQLTLPLTREPLAAQHGVVTSQAPQAPSQQPPAVTDGPRATAP